MAERRTRPNPMDRRLISERTAKSLRLQAAPPHIYRGRANRMGRRRFFHPEYLASNPDEMDFTEEEDELGMFPPSGAEFEGARINSNLYQAYAPTLHFPEGTTRTAAEPSPLSSSSTEGPEFTGELVTSPRPQSPSIPVGLRTNFWGSVPSGATLTRQNSIRRPVRSRTNDFNDFTFRRRSTTRQNSTQGTEPPRSDDPGDGTWQFPVLDRLARQIDGHPPSSSAASAPSPRRFFPLPAFPHPPRRRIETSLSDHWLPEPREPSPPTANDVQDPLPVPHTSQSSSQLWYSLRSNGGPSIGASSTPGITSASTILHRRVSSPTLSGERRQVVAPRLRRGGVRAPESLLSRYASPSMTEPATIANSLPATVETATVTSSTNGTEVERNEQEQQNSPINDVTSINPPSPVWERREEEMRQLLTPRSVSPATES